jgi:sigma-B regulation protein RsbU (phosphoserine phosphatase)
MLTRDAARLLFRDLLRGDAPSVVLGIVITTAALAALATYLARTKNRPPQLLSFGLFSLLYGVRLLLKAPTVQLAFDIPGFKWSYVESTIGNLILIPVVQFVEQIYGKGWKSSIRWMLWFFTAYAVFATGFELAFRDPHAAPDAGGLFLILLVAVEVLGYFAGYRPLPLRNRPVLLAGLGAFFITFVNEHLILFSFWPWHVGIEPIGFFVLICTMGYLAIRQSVENEQNLRTLEEEMRSARRIQASILPRTVPRIEGATIAVRYLPMTSVAGDFYEFVSLGPGRIGIAIADVAGHGVPAALVASMVKVAIDSQSASAADPPVLMAGLNEIMCRQARGNLITAAYLFLDLAGGHACYAAAAHPPLLVRRRGNPAATEFRENGLILGVRPGETYEAMPFDLRSGDRLLLYTDGIAEAANAKDQLFSEERLSQVLAEHDGLDAAGFAERIVHEVRAWAGSDQADDMTLVVVDIA